jgi:trk system potassium uptake protein TrkA
MRIAFVGGGELTAKTAERLIKQGHKVVIVESDKSRIDELSEILDCSFLEGDGSNPAVLREVDPEGTEMLLCLTGKDQDNIIASLVGRSLGFQRVFTRIVNPEYESICVELGLTDTIIPSRTISRFLVDMIEGVGILELSTVLRGDARFFVFAAREEDAGPVKELGLGKGAKAICFYHGDEFHIADEDSELAQGDDVVVLTDRSHIPALRDKWKPQQ